MTATTGMHRPARLTWQTELPRATAELWRFWAAYPVLAAGPRGDGHTVLVLPGFLAGDASTGPLRLLLCTLGYRPLPWTLGRNLGPSHAVLDGMSERLVAAHERSGRRVSVIGWSLGGVYGRHLARRHPELVRQVITLGSPFRLDPRADNRHVTHTGRLYAAGGRWHSREFTDVPPEAQRAPLPVPSTAVYTRGDGVVPWRSTIQPTGPTAENVEVRGSHCGLGHNVAAVAVITDRLAQPEAQWRPYRP